MKKLIAESASIAFKQKLTKAQIIVLIGLWNHSLTMLRPLETLMPLMFNVENLNRLGGLDLVNSLNDLRNQALNNPTGGFNRDQRLWGVPKNRGNGNPPSPSKAPGQPSPSVRAKLKKMEKPRFANELIDEIDPNYPTYVKLKSPTTSPLPERFNIEDYTIDELVDRITNPITGRVDSQSVDEGITLYQAEHEKIIFEGSRPTRAEALAVNLDYKVKGMIVTLPDGRSYTWCDAKGSVGSEVAAKTNRTLAVASFEVEANSVKQKGRFVGQGGLESADLVAHLIDLYYVPEDEKAFVVQKILEGARSIGSDQGIFFMNDK